MGGFFGESNHVWDDLLHAKQSTRSPEVRSHPAVEWDRRYRRRRDPEHCAHAAVKDFLILSSPSHYTFPVASFRTIRAKV